MSRETALVVCPGRGVYNTPELGYLARHHAEKAELVAAFDAQRSDSGQPSIAALDARERFSRANFLRGDNASGLIYACSYADFLSIDRERFEVVAVTGNSMGWYTALACAGALSGKEGFRLVNTMGTIMHAHSMGGQFVYPAMGADWRPDEDTLDTLHGLIAEIDGLHLSIRFGGMLVLAGEDTALDAAEARLPKVDGRFPMRLPGHGAFHTPLMEGNAARGREALPASVFASPDLPLVDGHGAIWWPGACDVAALHAYTLGHQVVEPFDFTAAVQIGLTEFAPDYVIVLGPGNTLGGATAQAMLGVGWNVMQTKADFTARQAADPVLLAMGHAEQRDRVTG